MQKMIDFYHNKGIDMLKLGCTLPKLSGLCLHKSTTANFQPFTESDWDLLEKNFEDIVGGPSVVLTRKAVVDETIIRDSTNLCKIIVAIDASQFYPFSMCQLMPTGLYTRCELGSESGKDKTRQNKTNSLENTVMSCFQRVKPQSKVESFCTTGMQKKNWCIMCWWLLLTLQHCVWNNGMLLSLLPMSRSSSFSQWGRSSARY